ncbi:MAG: hypothetical protein J6R50_05270 [Alistipes sp.]|nr:hypothetical protein [Alistipes sp.]
MRRNLRQLFVVIIAALGFVACQHDTDHITPETFEVKFVIDTESRIGTRAISDGTGATQLSWAVFNDEGELIHKKATKDNVGGLLTEDGYSMYISLAKGQTYKVAFWAQNPECDAYTLSDDMKVTINYEGVNNDERRDAFTAVTEPFTVDGNNVVSVVLRRPFAQVNVGAYPWDMQYAVESGLTVTKSAAKVEGVANVINLFDGSVEGEVDVEYTFNAIPEEDLKVDVDENGEVEIYEYLSMSYLLADTTPSSHKMSFTFTDESETAQASFLYSGLEFVPIQRNWRTNIVGQILTGDISFNIKIDPIYENEQVHSGGLYYNFTEDTLIEGKYFAFNTNEAATFTSENNNVITMNDVEFSGRVQYIAMGEYREKGSYIDFTNVMTNVRAENMVVDHPGIENVKAIDYMAPLVFLRGVSTLENCSFTGTTTTAGPLTDNYGDIREVLPYDCGVPNNCEAIFNNCTVDRLYAWSHSMITLTNSTLKYIRCSTHHNSYAPAHLTIGEGTVVDEICVTSSGLAKRVKDENGNWHWIDDPANRWAPSLIIKAGAHVKRLDMNFRPSLDKYGNLSIIIEEGAIVDEIVNAIDEF